MGLKVDPGMRLLVWLAGVSLLIFYLTSQLHIVNGIGQFMPTAHQSPELQALMNETQSGPLATTLMLRLSGDEAAELAKLSTQISQELNAQDEVFRDVRNSNTSIDDNAVDALFPYRYLLGEKQDWSQAALKNSFEQRLVELRVGAGAMLGKYLTQDPQMVFIKYLHGIFNVSGPALKHGVWFDAKEEAALIVVHVRSDSLDLDIMQRAVDDIHRTFNLLTSAKSAQLEIAGPGIMAVETRASIEQVVTRLSIFMTMLLVLVFTIAYRNLYLLLLAGIPLLSAVVVALAVTQFIFHQIHGIVLAFGITLLGVCLDYPLHLFSHLRKGEQASYSLNRIWSLLLLSGASSILAYLALLGSGFAGLSQLAVFAASGLVVALVVTRYMLPYWVSSGRVNPRLWTFNAKLSPTQRTGLAMLLLCLPALFIVQAEVFWETSIEAISPVPASAVASDRKLRHDLNLPEVSHVFIKTGEDLEAVMQASENLAQQLLEMQERGIVTAIWSPTKILPSAQLQRERQSLLPPEQQLLDNLNTALHGLPFKPAAFAPWIDSVVDSHDLEPVNFTSMMATPLADALRQGMFKHGGLWMSTLRVSGVQSKAELYRWLDSRPDVKASHVEIKRATEHLLVEYRRSTFERFICVVLLLTFIMLFWSRSIKSTVRIMLPVCIGTLTGLAVPLLFGVAINVFHLLALLLVLGMGLDYSLFFNRINGDELDRKQRTHAISISALTTSAAFSVLAFSSVPVMVAMGQTVAAGVLMCFVSALVLSSPTGKIT
jgi:predicted exporter